MYIKLRGKKRLIFGQVINVGTRAVGHLVTINW